MMAALATAQTADASAFEAAVASGDPAAAVEAGKAAFEALKAAHPDSASLAAAEKRLAAIKAAAGLAAYKFNLITKSAGSASTSPFLFVTPTPKEFYTSTRNSFAASRPAYDGLPEREAAFLKAYLAEALSAADRMAIEGQAKVVEAKPGDEAVATSRAYLSAYVIGSHGGDEYPALLPAVSRAFCAGKMPIFLADDALGELGDIRAASEVVDAFDKATGLEFPADERLRLLKAMADMAEKGSDNEWAVVVYGKIADKADAVAAEEAQRSLIRVYADKMKNYERAAEAAGVFLTRFPKSKEATNLEYLKALYEYQANQFDQALADVRAFKEKHAGSNLMASALLLEGLALTGQNKTDDAVKVYGELLKKHPKHRLAGKAQFLIGITYLSNQKYAEARDAFQRVVDFYPGDSYAKQAGEYVDNLSKLPQTAPAAAK